MYCVLFVAPRLVMRVSCLSCVYWSLFVFIWWCLAFVIHCCVDYSISSFLLLRVGYWLCVMFGYCFGVSCFFSSWRVVPSCVVCYFGVFGCLCLLVVG